MRRSIAIVICLVICLIFAGCKAVTTDAGDSDDKQTEGVKPVSDKDYDAIYDPVFAEVVDVVDNGYDPDREYKYVSNGLMEEVMYPGDRDLSQAIGYVMEDLTGDGIPELVIGDGAAVLSIFTVKDDKPYFTLDGWARNTYEWLGDSHFFNIGSNGAMSTLFGECHLSDDGADIIWDDFYFSDEKDDGTIGLYHNTEGIYDTAASEELDISDTEFFAKSDEYEERCRSFSYTPISDKRK